MHWRISILLALAISLVGNLPAVHASKTLQLADIVFTINKGGDNQKITENLKYPAKLPSTLPTIKNTDTVKLSFTASFSDGSALPGLHQAVLSLQSTDPVSRVATQIATKLDVAYACDKGRGASYSVSTDFGTQDTIDAFLAHSGSYDAILYIAHSESSTPLAYPMGSIRINFPINAQVSIKPSMPESFRPEKEIHHIFRLPDKQAPKWLSGLFTILVVVPWVFLLAAWGILGANISNAFEPSTIVPAIAFFASLGGWVYLMYMYWLKLNMFQFLYYGGLLGLATFVVGRRALVDRAQLRLKKGY
ncbi:dolichyl-diphosphooligosaccharide---protein glycotransferase [Synchytrium microbalum]|uniref:Ribophorin II n=1 Tax=Synchytrium microbalum TaxID=1806994 RepID=A0A507C6A4_9FUNG|nr:dolichyl-diphosphooligosaccharide---protein glycotransferase [Synchytrium microbalum]TPX33594.1 dolichyl-diphosphooligosaccharide---protein glycotransferase [Synchytrium microbalum]